MTPPTTRTAAIGTRLLRFIRRHVVACLAVSFTVILAAVLVREFASNREAPLPPELKTTGFDPAVAAAINEARQAVADQPWSAELWGNLGKVLLAHELRVAARACFLRAAELSPKEPRWPYYLGWSQRPEDPALAATHLMRSLALLSNAADSYPSTSDGVRLTLAETLLHEGDMDRAEAHYREVWARCPTSGPAAFGLGKVANARDRPAEASEFLLVATRDPATRKAAHRLLISVYQRLGRTNEVEPLTRSLSSLPDDVPWPDPFIEEIHALKTGENTWVDQADEWIKTGRLTDAVQLLERTLRTYPESPRALFFLGRARQRLGDFAGAEALLAKALQRSPGMIEAHMQLGVLHLARGRTAEAQQSFRTVITAKPNLAEAWYNLGLSLGGGDREGSKTAFREAIRLKPGLAEAYLGLSVVLRAEGNRQEAADVLRRALALAPREPLRQRLLDQLKLVEPP